MKRKPRLYIIAGPNGAGKTTFARRFLPQYADCREFVNADLIAGGLSPFSPETVAFRAGRLMLQQIRTLGKRRRNFGFETTLSGRTYLSLLRRLKARGYVIHLFFLWIPTVELALARVADRVRRGGHDVAEAVVRRRFDKGLKNLFGEYHAVLDSWILFDNSTEAPRVIASGQGEKIRVANHELFATLTRHKSPR